MLLGSFPNSPGPYRSTGPTLVPRAGPFIPPLQGRPSFRGQAPRFAGEGKRFFFGGWGPRTSPSPIVRVPITAPVPKGPPQDVSGSSVFSVVRALSVLR